MRGRHRSNARTRTRTDLCHRLAELFTRQIESERQCEATAPGLDNPLCIGLPATRSDARVLSHADAAAAAYEVPYDKYPAPGSRGLPLPRSIVEAMSFMAFGAPTRTAQLPLGNSDLCASF